MSDIVDHKSKRELVIDAFIYSLRELHASSPQYYPEHQLEEDVERLRKGKKIEVRGRKNVSDRFARFCQELHIMGDDYREFRDEVLEHEE